jgi:hypothetical protein
MIKILPPLGKYKNDTCRILSIECGGVAICPLALGWVGRGQNRSLNPMLQESLRLVRGGDAEDALKPLVHHAPPSLEGADNASRDATTAAPFWLVLAMAGSYCSVRSIAAVWPTSSVDSRWRRSAGLASIAVRSSTKSPWCHTAFHLMSSCRVRCCSTW